MLTFCSTQGNTLGRCRGGGTSPAGRGTGSWSGLGIDHLYLFSSMRLHPLTKAPSTAIDWPITCCPGRYQCTVSTGRTSCGRPHTTPCRDYLGYQGAAAYIVCLGSLVLSVPYIKKKLLKARKPNGSIASDMNQSRSTPNKLHGLNNKVESRHLLLQHVRRGL